MFRRRVLQIATVAFLSLIALAASLTRAAAPPQVKGPGGNGIASVPSAVIQNDHLKALSSNGGRFIIGTTRGDPNTPNDDSKRILYGYPSNVGSSFSTLRIANGGTTTDYRLGSTDWAGAGVAPVAPPTADGTTIKTTWAQSGIRVEERLFFAQNADTNRRDTTAIEYTLTNTTAESRNVGIRILLDTMIGDNDGAPFFILGSGQLSQEFEFPAGNIPQFWDAYESTTFASNSLKARGQLTGGDATKPDRFVIAHWGATKCGGVPGLFESNWAYTPNPNFTLTCDSAVALYYNPAALGPGQTRTYRTYYGIAKSGEAAQVELTGLEVTQGLQNLKNNVVLIQDRPTIVRAFMRSTSDTIPGMRAKLIGTRIQGGNRTPLGVRDARSTVNVAKVTRRVSISDNFYFDISKEWLNGTVEFTIQGDNYPISICKEPDSQSDCKIQVTFTPSPIAHVRFVGINWKENQNGTVHEAIPVYEDFEQAARQIDSVFPIPSLDWDSPYNIEPVFFAGPPTETWHFARLTTMLSTQRALDCISEQQASCWKRYYLGVLIDTTGGHGGGMAGNIPSDVAVGFLDYNHTLAHELGHAAGRSHTNYNRQRNKEPKENCTKLLGNDVCIPIDTPDPADGTISQSKEEFSADSVYGYDRFWTSRHRPDTADMMSYGSPNWPSAATYSSIRSHFASRYSGMMDAVSSGHALIAAGDTVMIVSGIVSPTLGTGNLFSAYTISSSNMVPAPEIGSYALRFENGQGQTLAIYRFEPFMQPVNSGDRLPSPCHGTPISPVLCCCTTNRNSIRSMPAPARRA